MDRMDGIERSVNNRAAVTNGRRLLIGVDGRTIWARRFKDLVDLHLSDLGGPDNVSEAERSIVRRASTLEVECERLEASFALAEMEKPSGRPSTAHLDLYNRLSGSLRRLLESIGLRRRARAITDEPGELEQLLSPEEYEEYVGPANPTQARRNATRDRAKREARRRTR